MCVYASPSRALTCRQALEQDGSDGAFVDSLHFDLDFLQGDTIAHDRHASQRLQHQPADRRRVPRQVRADQGLQFAQTCKSRCANAAVGQLLRTRVGMREFVAKVAKHLGQHVLQRHQAFDASVLVDQYGLLAAVFAKQRQQPIRSHSPRDRKHRPRQLRDGRNLALLDVTGNHVLGVEHADDVVLRAAYHRKPRIRAFGHPLEHQAPRRVGVNRDHVQSGHHQLTRGPLAQPQCLIEPALLLRFQQTAVAAFRNQQFDLLGRMDVAMSTALHTQCPQNQGTTAVEHGNEPREHPQRPDHGKDRRQGGGRGELQRQGLGYKLAQNHLANGQTQ